MIRLTNRWGAEIRVEGEEQADYWRALGYRSSASPKPAKKAPAKKAAPAAKKSE